VQFPNGSTLKVTMVVFSNELCSTFTAMSSRTLLSDHVRYRGETRYENLPTVCDISLYDQSHEYTNGNHSQEDQQEGPSLRKMM